MKYEMQDEPWKVRDRDFPTSADRSEQLRHMLNYAIMAPSIYNTQPWLFKVTGSEIAMYVDRARALPVSDPHGRNLVISCGAALYHLRVAIRHFGYEPVVRTFPDLDVPNLLAFIRLGKRKDVLPDEERQFMAIKKRRTIRNGFRDEAIPSGMMQQLRDSAVGEGAQMFALQDQNEQQALIDLIREAYEIRQKDASFLQEIKAWTNSGWADHPINDMSYAAPPPGAEAPQASRILRGLEDDQLLLWNDSIKPGHPAFMVLATTGDRMASWLSAGQALARLLLTAADSGLSTSFLNQPVGIDSLRDRLRALIGGELFPQVILRMGFGVPGKPTRRLPVDRVATDN